MADQDSRRAERRLVRRMLAGEEAAFESFVDDYLPPLYRYACRRLRGNRELTRDVVQSTVCKAFANLASFRGEAALGTWLCACCNNEIAAHYRAAGRFGNAVELEAVEEGRAVRAEAPGRFEAPESELLRGETAERVHAALDSLPPHYGRALEWKYLEELPVREIAGRLDLSPKAAESLLTRARLAFRRAYADLAGGGEGALSSRPPTGRRLEFGS